MSNFNKKYIEHCERRIQDILNDEREYSDWTQICFSMKDAIHAAVEVWGISKIANTTKLPMFDMMLTIHKQKCIVDLGIQR